MEKETQEEIKRLQSALDDQIATTMRFALSSAGFSEVLDDANFTESVNNFVITITNKELADKQNIGTFTGPGESTIEEDEPPRRLDKLVMEVQAKTKRQIQIERLSEYYTITINKRA